LKKSLPNLLQAIPPTLVVKFFEHSEHYAPWFIIPADDKWFARLAIASVIHHHFDQLYLSYLLHIH
jgi:hypothetical protein